MQTFLPDPSFARSAELLDDRRLGKQRVETLQILRAMHLEDYGWRHHPAVAMWRGYTRALVGYGLAVVDEWRRRGRADTTRPQIAEFAWPSPAVSQERLEAADLPPWLGSEAVHRSHRSALLRKDPDHYRLRFPDVPADLPYEWPAASSAAAAPEPFSAWVVRAPSAADLDAFRAGGFVTADRRLASPSATPKQRRQLARFQAMRPGQAVAVPADGGLLQGTLTPAGTARDSAGRRSVAWRRTVDRADLRRPYQLQDPQTVFALRGEPAVEA